MARLKVTQIRSTINQREVHKRTIRALGLGKIRGAVVHDDTPQIRGMIRAVGHLVLVEKVD
ncbi:MAG TPA: 50S ribosomal protein L30 [Acidobacteriota bacterium]|nr:50S ribosomal protein L30 [Acidobacteriota bacterium]